MFSKFHCSVVGRDDQTVLEGEVFGTVSYQRQMAALKFAQLEFDKSIKGKVAALGKQFEVLVDDDVFEVNVLVDVSVKKKKRVFHCEIAGDHEVFPVEASDPRDACIQFLKLHWEPRHGVEFMARVRPDFVVRASVSANGLSFNCVDPFEWNDANGPKAT